MTFMKNLILIRHGEYDDSHEGTGSLISSGKEAVTYLGQVIASKVKGNFYIASSGVKRADQSADILREVLGINQRIERLDCLDYQNKHLEEARARAIYQTIREKECKADNLILVSHIGVINEFPDFFMKANSWKSKFEGHISKGSGVCFNLEDKTYEIITPQYDRSGNICRYIGVNVDITERKLYQQRQEILLTARKIKDEKGLTGMMDYLSSKGINLEENRNGSK